MRVLGGQQPFLPDFGHRWLDFIKHSKGKKAQANCTANDVWGPMGPSPVRGDDSELLFDVNNMTIQPNPKENSSPY